MIDLQTSRRRADVVIALLIAAGTLLLLAGTASAAGIKPLEREVEDAWDIAFDGTDYYWLEERSRRDKATKKRIFESVLLRASFQNKSVTQIAAFSNDTHVTPDWVSAGGGYVYVTLADIDESVTRIVRMARDGSGQTRIASGKRDTRNKPTFQLKNGVVRLSDCGTTVEVLSVSAAGGVVIRETTAERESASCGRKRNWDQRRYYEVTPAGATREITTDGSAVTHKIKLRGDSWQGAQGPVKDALAYPEVYGDKAIYASGRYDNFFIRDLVNGSVTGPYVRPLKGSRLFSDASLGPAGQLAYSSFRDIGEDREIELNSAVGLFDTNTVPAAFKPIGGDVSLRFCGSHLIADDSVRGARELDPATGAKIRQISPARVNGSPVFFHHLCSPGYYYAEGLTKDYATVLFAFPLN